MARFCTNCGKALEEGELCGCMNQQQANPAAPQSNPEPQQTYQQMNQQQQAYRASQQQNYQHVQQPMHQQFYQEQPPIYGAIQGEKRMGWKKGVYITQIVVGSFLLLAGFASIDYDWGIIACTASIGFLVTGILELMHMGK